ncbi:hypothetical protein ACJRO7_028887 [Eucalyptus globulus]|uniref:Uncharacterized protein n=1 Tax=Eucalyptus globulus TaxID=34317 RepID=A0ABD3JXC5_EUCGL
MSNPCTTKKSPGKGSKARLPPKRGQVKVRIFRMAVKKVTCLASTVGLGRKGSRVAGEPDSASLAGQE